MREIFEGLKSGWRYDRGTLLFMLLFAAIAAFSLLDMLIQIWRLECVHA